MAGRPLESARRGLSPRVHNTVSYTGAAAVFCTAVLAQRSSGSCNVFPPTHHASWPLTAREIAIICWVLHFVRRAAESAWLHRYSQPTVPILDTATELLYYWVFAVCIAHSVVCTDSPRAALSALQLSGVFLWFLAEVGNCHVHVQLARLRPPDAAADPREGRRRAGAREALRLPEGRCFELVSFPHYLCEISSWVGWNLLIGLPSPALDAALWNTHPIAALEAWSGVLFACLGAAIMTSWADEKHSKLRQHFNGKEGKPRFPSHRKRILPYIY